jgi:hypothetical protein
MAVNLLRTRVHATAFSQTFSAGSSSACWPPCSSRRMDRTLPCARGSLMRRGHSTCGETTNDKLMAQNVVVVNNVAASSVPSPCRLDGSVSASPFCCRSLRTAWRTVTMVHARRGGGRGAHGLWKPLVSSPPLRAQACTHYVPLSFILYHCNHPISSLALI